MDLITDFVYPLSCVGCDREGVSLCQECLEDLNYAEQICPECGEESTMGWTHEKCRKKKGMDGLVCIYAYEDEKVRRIVDEIKFGFNQGLVGQMMQSCVFDLGIKFDLVAPIPLHFYRENWRGFNQAKLMAEEIGRATGLRVEEPLIRIKPTQQQSLTKTREERSKNLKGAFSLRRGRNLSGKKILLVDDVFTSGASMKEATRVLKAGGARVVWGLSLAH